MKRLLLTLALTLLATPILAAQPLMETLQQTSVTIKADRGQGSGSLFNREIDGQTVTFCWTAGHVVDSLRRTRSVIDPNTGTSRTVIEFDDARIVQELVENGRRVGEVQMDAEVIRYSDADYGEDLALLQIRKRNFNPDEVTTTFYLDDGIPSIGTELYHVGSLRGQIGANSLTTGVISQIGRVLNVGDEVVFDQTTVTAFPGSSGGGVYLRENGQYVGMLVRGAGETFNLMVPVRRMRAWATDADVLWALDPSVPVPSLDEIDDLPVEDTGVAFASSESKPTPADLPKELQFLLKVID